MALAITVAGGGAKSAKFHAKYSEKSSIFGHFSPQIAASRAFAGLGVVPRSFLDVVQVLSGPGDMAEAGPDARSAILGAKIAKIARP